LKTIAVMNQKGGVGKTTTAVNFGCGLAIKGKRVLMIDIDAQADLTKALGFDDEALDKDISSVLLDLNNKTQLDDVMISRTVKVFNDVTSIDLVPASSALCVAELTMAGLSARELKLRRALKSFDGAKYDYCIIDCPPHIGVLALNALAAADEVLIPIQTEYLPLKGISRLLDILRMVKEELNADLIIAGVVGQKYDTQKRLYQEVKAELLQYFGDKVFDTFIPQRIALAEAPSKGLSIYEYKPYSDAAQKYMAMCEEFLAKEKANG